MWCDDAVMSIYPAPDAAPAVVLLAAREQIAKLGDRLPAGLSDDELVAGLEALQLVQGAEAALEAGFLAELDAREVPKKKLHWGSTSDWFTHLAGLHRREGRRRVRRARQLVEDETETLESMRAGKTSPTQAEVICNAVETVPPAVRQEAEALLIEESTRLTATELAKAGRHLAAVVDPDREERKAEAALDREERASHLGRFLSVVDDGMGGVRIKGFGSVEDGAILRSALLPLTKPAPAVDPDDPTCRAETDPRDHGARMWDAMVQLAQHALDTDLPPESHGARPRVGVTIPLEDLKDGCGDPASTEDGLELSAATVRRLACDADLIPICLGTNGQVLDVGRTQRLVTLAIWTALLCRDLHCTFPGCTRPPSMCHAHHIVHWTDGGPTSLGNLVMLCGEHHRVIHHTPWQVRLNPDDGRPEFLPPRRGLPSTEWIRRRRRRE